MPKRLEGKVALITGAGSGIGRESAILFAKEGAKVAVIDIFPEKGEETVKIIKENGGEATFVQADVSNNADAEKIIQVTVERYCKVDILFNNAGINPRDAVGLISNLSDKVWDRVINVNLKGVFLCSKYVIPQMIKNGGGVIINTSSITGLEGYSNLAIYSASKGGVISLTKTMALDLGPYNIRVNCLCPGTTLTPLVLNNAKKERLQDMQKEFPLGRLGKPKEQAYAALYLASDESSFVTGTCLISDGGWMAGKFYRAAPIMVEKCETKHPSREE